MEKVLNEEVMKYSSEKNTEDLFTLSNLEKEIELSKMHIELLEKDSSISSNTANYETYINDLKAKLISLHESYNSLKNSLSSNNVSAELVDIIKSKLKHFIYNIKIETAAKQGIMIKEFVDKVRYNLRNDVVETKVVVYSPENSSEIIFEKYLYGSY